MVGLTFSVGDTMPGLQLVLSKTIRISDTKNHIQCSSLPCIENGPRTHNMSDVMTTLI